MDWRDEEELSCVLEQVMLVCEEELCGITV